jgi:HCOMODA/2-hydroxy-3-carboxy-muconic semialdehyde decarboxylase
VTAMPLGAGCTAKDDELAQAVVDAARVLSAEGLIEAFGHVSARSGASSFLLTPRQGLSSVTAEELLELDLDPEVPEGYTLRTGNATQVPIEAAIHGALYLARDDVGAVIRDHGFASTVLGVTGIPLVPVHALGAAVPGVVPVHDSSALISQRGDGAILATLLGSGSALLMRGNGRVIVGNSVAEACAKALLLEESAKVQLAARSAGASPRPLSEAEAERAGHEVASRAQLLRVWEHMLRKHGLTGSLHARSGPPGTPLAS